MPPNFLNPYRPTFYILQICVWTSFWIASNLVWIVYTPPSWLNIFTEKMTGLLFSTGLAFIFWAMRNRKFHTQILIGLVLTAIFGLVWRISYNIIELHLIRDALPVDLSFKHYFWHSSIAVLRLLPWTIGYFLLTYYAKYREAQDRAQEAALQAKDAQLKLLHLQISPHFLFNVLNSLDTLLLKENVAESRRMLGKLSLFLRQTLKEDPAHSIPLQQELERARTYIEIEKVRFQDKLSVEWDIDPTLEDFQVPSLILQPLIENAIKHSVAKSLHGGHITISAQSDPGGTRLIVRNKSNGLQTADTNAENGLGIGLENTISRLKVTYGDQAHLSSKKHPDGTFEVHIVIGNQ